jgi:hypothetical protein
VPTLLAGCFLAAVLSLLLPSEPSYDPWAWLAWGREIPLLELDTTGGPSWKPLTVIVTALLAPLAKLDDVLPPALWLVIARAFGLLALVLAFRLAARLAGPPRWAQVGAGLVAATALALSPQWLRYLAHGNEAPAAVALMLWGIERHFEGARQQAFLLGILACLIRPEVFPFVAVYAVFLWRAEPGARWRVAGLAALLPLLWLVPEWIGSGNPLDAGRQATSEPSWSLSLADRPWEAALERAHRLTTIQLELAALAAVAFAIRARDRTVLVFAGVAVAWLGLYVGMTQAGFSGSPRYLLPTIVLVCLLAGVGTVRVVDLAAALAGRLGLRRAALAGGAAAVALLALGAWPYIDARQDDVRRQATTAEELADLHGDLEDAVSAAGGRDRVNLQGSPAVNRAFHTHLAWILHTSIRNIELGHGQALVFDANTTLSAPAPIKRRIPIRDVIARVGAWEVYRAGRIRSSSAGGGQGGTVKAPAREPAAQPDGASGESPASSP